MKICLLTKVAALVLLTLGFYTTSYAQLTIDESMTPDEMTNNLVGTGVSISNTTIVGADGSYGYYYSNATEIGTSEGILLTTGQAINALGPNDQTGFPLLDSLNNCLNCDTFDNGSPGDPLLNAVFGVTSWDACSYEFDIVPQGDSLKFEYHFASEEYLEWVGSPFNDVFGFFITGPGLAGVNLATIPGTTDAVSINSVNHIDNTSFFYNNTDPVGDGVQYDGFTINTVAAIGNLIPCETYHIKLVIADVSDRLYDSGVFISRIESNPVTIETTTVEGLPYMIEGCNDGYVNFINPFPSPGDINVEFTLSGTADFPADFTTNPDITPFYNALTDSYSMIILDGDTAIGFEILPVFDGLDEPGEFVTIDLSIEVCDTASIQSSVDFYIADELPVSLDAPFVSVCPDGCVELNGDAETQGTAVYFWTPLDGMTNETTLNPTVCPDVTTEYTLNSAAGACSNSVAITVTVTPLLADLDVTNTTCAGDTTGAIDLTMTTGSPGFTFAWTGPGGFTSDLEDISDLEEGEYCVTVTDTTGCSTEFCASVSLDNEMFINDSVSSYGCGNEISCNGFDDGFIMTNPSGGIPNYTWAWTGPGLFSSADQNILGLAPGEYTLTLTDDAGCTTTDTYLIEEPDVLSISVVGVVDVLCTGESNGQITVTATGACTPYIYSWSHDPTLVVPVINVPSGTFTATVIDQINGCESVDSVTVVVNDPIDPVTMTIDNIGIYPGGFNVSCPGASDGFVDITIADGTPGYDVVWEHSSGIQITDEDATGMICGEWTVTVTDDNGCSISEVVDLTCVPAIVVEYTVVQNPCGDPLAGLGEITIDVISGGHGGPYITDWISGPSCPCVGINLVGLNSGSYVLEVEDALGCTQEFTIAVGMNDEFIVNETIVAETCFEYCDASIDLDVIPVEYDSLTWAGPDGFQSIDEDLSGLCQGDYSVIIYSGDCEETFIYTIGDAQSSEIVITPDAIPPTCFGNSNGSISVILTGGTGVLTPEWTADPGCIFPASGSTDLLIDNLLDCEYYVTVTDMAGCQAFDTLNLEAPQVMDIFVSISDYGGGLNTSCFDSNDGSISVTVSGGTPLCDTANCYIFDWYDCNALPYPQYDGGFLNELPGGCYTVIVTDSLGCTATTDITLTPPDPIEINPTISPMSCTDTVADVIVVVTGGTGFYVDYEWLDSDITAENGDTIFNLLEGEYCVVITDNNDCESDTICFTVQAPEQLAINLDNLTDISCFGMDDGAISISGSGGTDPYSYEWTYPDDSNVLGNVILDLGPGTYEVLVTDSTGCSNTANYDIVEPDSLTVSLFVNTVIDNPPFTIPCKGDSIIIQSIIEGGTQDYNFLWEECDNTFIDSTSNTLDIGVGCYNLTITDDHGCIASDNIDVTEPDSVLVVTSIVSLYPNGLNLSCFDTQDGNICLDVIGGVIDYNYFWTSGNDTVSFTPCVDSLSAGLIDALVIDANGCDTLLMFNLTAPPEITLTYTVSVTPDENYNISCYGACDGTIDVVTGGGSGVLDITWDPDTFSGNSLSDLCAGEYVVTVTDEMDCDVEETIDIIEPDSLSLSATVNSLTCFGDDDGSIFTFTGGGSGSGYTYEWTPNGEVVSEISGLDGGIYCVTVTDLFDCTANECWEVGEPEELVSSAVTIDATCGLCNGDAVLTIDGGTGSYTESWIGSSPPTLCVGENMVIITDGVGCTDTIAVTVGGPAPLDVIADVTDLQCFGSEQGEIDLTLSEISESVTWTDSEGIVVSNAADLDGVNGGFFTYSIAWGDGCVHTDSTYIYEPDQLFVDGYSPADDFGFNIADFGGDTGVIIIDPSGGTPGYTCTWDGPVEIPEGLCSGLDSLIISDLISGDYNLTITDVNNCTVDTLFILTEVPDLALPTGITPNGDGSNDAYVILGVHKYTNNTFKVFNRWGNIVYEKDNYNNEWVGQNNDGEELPNATYYIVFEADDKQFATFVDLRR